MAKVKTEQQKALDQAMDLIINSGADLSSIFNFIGHLLAVLLSYQLVDDKPSVHILYRIQADFA